MEEFKKKTTGENTDKEIVFSKSIKAGKRIYYLDVKKNRKEEMFLAITESKKVTSGEGENMQVAFEKHKIFLYKEDFEKFLTGLQQTISFITTAQGEATGTPEKAVETAVAENMIEQFQALDVASKIEIDIDFE